MQLSSGNGSVNEISADLVVIGRFASEGPSTAEATIDHAFGGQLGAAAERMLFKGKPRQKVALDRIF